ELRVGDVGDLDLAGTLVDDASVAGHGSAALLPRGHGGVVVITPFPVSGVANQDIRGQMCPRGVSLPRMGMPCDRARVGGLLGPGSFAGKRSKDSVESVHGGGTLPGSSRDSPPGAGRGALSPPPGP